jgi:tRNA threonylcarbamoyladenosine biosynthesis protein TsaE
VTAVPILHIATAEAMEALGARLATADPRGCVIHLEGDLGAGKTTLVRGLLRALGYGGAVKSPTFTLVEPYELVDLRVFHYDLYRMVDPEELEYLGMRDFLAPDALSLIEWPERGGGVLPAADVVVGIRYDEPGRRVELRATSAAGEALLGRAGLG